MFEINPAVGLNSFSAVPVPRGGESQRERERERGRGKEPKASMVGQSVSEVRWEDFRQVLFSICHKTGGFHFILFFLNYFYFGTS